LPESSGFSSLLNYWPIFSENALSFAELSERLAQIGAEKALEPRSETVRPVELGKRPEWDETERRALLATTKLEKLDYAGHPLDLMTDSWHYVKRADKRSAGSRRHAQEGYDAALENEIRRVFPFAHQVLTPQGKIAEALFYKALERPGKTILSSIPWTTTLASQLENGFDVVEIPDRAAMVRGTTSLFKGGLDLRALRAYLEKEADNVACVGLEALNNASGGHPISVEHLETVKSLIEPFGIPLVLDISRILRNAFLIRKHAPEHSDDTLVRIVQKMCSFSDHIVGSLTKDFAVAVGGLIATNDSALAERARRLATDGERLTGGEQREIADALSQLDATERLIARQLAFTERLGDLLKIYGVPVLGPARGHAVVIDVSPLVPADSPRRMKEEFLSALFIKTGIRGSVHQTGKQRNTPLHNTVRLAVPLGLEDAELEVLLDRLQAFFLESSYPAFNEDESDDASLPREALVSDERVDVPMGLV
jgi:tryptophanase